MKTLIAIATLGFTLGFSSLTLADSYIFGVKVPIVENEVENNVKGGDVEKDFISFYTTPKTGNTIDTLKANQSSDDEKDYIVVFGVRVPLYSRI